MAQKTGVPVTVNPTVMPNEMGEAPLDLKMKVGPDDVAVHLKKDPSK